MTQDITKEEAERRLGEAGVPFRMVWHGVFDWHVSLEKCTYTKNSLAEVVEYAISDYKPQHRRWTEAEVRREFERDALPELSALCLISTDFRVHVDGRLRDAGTWGHVVETALRRWYGIDEESHIDAVMSGMARFARPETRNCALGVVGYSVEKKMPVVAVSAPEERDAIRGDVEGFFPMGGGPGLLIVSPKQLKDLQAIAAGAKADMRKASLTTAQRDCIYVPRAYEVLQELYSACVLNTLDENHLKQAAAIIARHLGEPVPDARQKVFTLHTKLLESGEWECRVQTIDRWCAAVVTGKTREEAEASAERVGRVL